MFRPSTTPAVVILGSFVVVLVGLTVAVLTVRHASTPEPGAATTASADDLSHIHGLGVDPGDGALYIASHFGVFRHANSSTRRVADRWQDTMGFAVVGASHFLASGHPDLREDLPVQLGLIDSTDGARTWEALSRRGTGDFHAIEPAGDTRVYAYESTRGQLLITHDRRTWQVLDRRALVDLAVDVAHPEVVYATTPTGALLRYDTSDPQAGGEPVTDAPRLTHLDWQDDGPLVGAGSDGSIYTSDAPDNDWRHVSTLHGPVVALDAVAGRWHVATGNGVVESTDAGRTWSLVLGDAPQSLDEQVDPH